MPAVLQYARRKIVSALTFGVSTTLERDLLQHARHFALIGMWLRFSGTVTAVGGGGVAGLTEDAPFGLIKRIRLNGQHSQLGSRRIIDLQGRVAHWLGNFHLRCDTGRTAPTPGAGASGQFKGSIFIPFTDPNEGVYPAYLDVRDYSSLMLYVDTGALTDYASTNVDSISAAKIEIELVAVESGIPQFAGHFEPRFEVVEHPHTAATSRDVTRFFGGGGLVPYVVVHTHDDSATGDSQRTNGLVGKLKLTHGGEEITEGTWAQILDATKGDRALAQATSMPAGYGVLQWSPANDPRSYRMTLTRELQAEIDSSEAPPADITDVVPASGDRVDLVALVLEPNAAARRSILGA